VRESQKDGGRKIWESAQALRDSSTERHGFHRRPQSERRTDRKVFGQKNGGMQKSQANRIIKTELGIKQNHGWQNHKRFATAGHGLELMLAFFLWQTFAFGLGEVAELFLAH
jgi:hypothetical protein